MIWRYRVQGKVKYVPRFLWWYFEYVYNLGIYRLTRDPHVATRFSSKLKARKAIKWYKRL